MKHPKVTDSHDADDAKVEDRSRIVYNDWITVGAIPERAYGYELGSRSADIVDSLPRLDLGPGNVCLRDPEDTGTYPDATSATADTDGSLVVLRDRADPGVNVIDGHRLQTGLRDWPFDLVALRLQFSALLEITRMYSPQSAED